MHPRGVVSRRTEIIRLPAQQSAMKVIQTFHDWLIPEWPTDYTYAGEVLELPA